MQGRYQEAIAAFQQAKIASPSSSTPDFGLAQVYLAMGEPDQALSHFLKQSPESQRTPVVRIVLVSIQAASKDVDAALATLHGALDAGYRDFAALDSNPYLKDLREDPRYRRLLQQYPGGSSRAGATSSGVGH